MESNKGKEEGFGLKELFLLGLGFMATLEEETKKTVDQLVKKGAERQEKGRKYIRDLKEREESKRMEARLEEALKKVVEIAGLATKEDIHRLEKRITETFGPKEEKGGPQG